MPARSLKDSTVWEMLKFYVAILTCMLRIALLAFVTTFVHDKARILAGHIL